MIYPPKRDYIWKSLKIDSICRIYGHINTRRTGIDKF